MSSSPISEPPYSPINDLEGADNNLQPFFVLHKAVPRKSERKPPGNVKARRKIDLPASSPKSLTKCSESRSDDADEFYEQLRLEAFNRTWSKIDSATKEVLRKINLDHFNEVHQWVSESFSVAKSLRAQNVSEIQRPFPIITDSIYRRIPTALIFTKNAEFVDDLLTFQELGGHLQSKGCHVANLSALNFSAKHGIGGCLRSLLKQLIIEVADVADITMLVSWYCEQANFDRPVIVIIDDIARCNGEILSEFITLLSEWVIKIPMFLIMGVATTVDVTRKLLPSNTLQHLQPYKFTLGSPCERMNALIETVLVKTCPGFNIGHRVAVFLRNYFFRHDGTITSFIRALKIACTKHFFSEPLSFLGLGMLDENCEQFWLEKNEALPDSMCQHAFDFPSCQREKVSRGTHDLIEGLSKLSILQKKWSSVVLCLFEVGKLNKMQLLDILCEAADPSLHNLRASDQKLQKQSVAYDNMIEGKCGFTKGGFLAQAIHKVRELPVGSLSRLLNIWSIHTEGLNEVHDNVKELQSVIRSADVNMMSKESAADIYKRLRSTGGGNGLQPVNDKAAMLLDSMIRKSLVPIESIPFHEIICFKNVDVLQSALIGDPRRTIQVDLLKSQSHFQCSCCSKGENIMSSSMHDTSIMYNLAQEYGDLINLHDWYQSFTSTTVSSSKTRRKGHHSPAAKKMKTTPPESEAMIQARFCRAITELQITGLLRMPSKRRPDFVQRVAFGL